MKSSSKKILYLRTDIYNQELVAGGSVTHTVGVINGLIHLGYSVIVASSCMQNVLTKLPIERLIRLKNPSFFSFLRWKLNCLISNIFFTLTIWRAVDFSTIDCIYQRYGILNCVGALLKKITGAKLILEYNGSEYWVHKNWGPKRLFSFSWLIGKVEMVNLKAATTIVVVSQVLKDELKLRGIEEQKVIVVPNGVDTDLYDPARLANEREAIRDRLGLTNDSLLIGFIGTFGPWHGIELLADTIPEILQSDVRTRFLLIGDGILAPFLKEAIKKLPKKHQDCVFFTGTLPSDEAKNYLAACDIFVCPTQPNSDGSPFFGSPTKLFEYMSLAKPVIASNLGQIPEIIQPAVYDANKLSSDLVGVLFDPASQNEFRAAVRSVINMAYQEREIMGAAARKRVVARFSWNMHARTIMEKGE